MYQKAYCWGLYDAKMVSDRKTDPVLNPVHLSTMVDAGK